MSSFLEKVGSIFGDQGGAFDDYSKQIAGLEKYYQPWMSQGLGANKALMSQDQRLLQSPAFMMNKLALQWHESPYQHTLVNNTMNAMNDNAANTGMLGTGSANQDLANRVDNMTNQFQNQYVTQALGQYDNGLNIANNIANRGMQATGGYVGLGQEAAAGQLQAGRANANFMGNIAGDIGSYLGIGSGRPGQGYGGYY